MVLAIELRAFEDKASMVGIQPCQVAGVLLEENPEVKSQVKYPLEVTGTRQMDEEARDKQ